MKLSPCNLASCADKVHGVLGVERHCESFFGRNRVISLNADSYHAHIEDFGRNFIEIGLPPTGNERCRSWLNFSFSSRAMGLIRQNLLPSNASIASGTWHQPLKDIELMIKQTVSD